MNHVYQTVFNKSTQTWMAVCEYACGASCNSISAGNQALVKGAVGKVTALSFTIIMALQSAHANTPTTIIADKSADKALQPIVLNTASGVVSVNIATPNARGLSNNHYSQFDVGSTGAVLNNNRKAVNTQIAGFVAANPYMARGEASTILNQVNSNHPSHLGGFIEVAGKKADVIIANPSGLVVNGAGFINAGNVHLAAANSKVNQAQVTAYEVSTGHIAAHGKLNLQGTDYAALITKTAQINDEIYAGIQLDVILGENSVSLQEGNLTQLITTHKNKGASSISQQGIALDISSLGGMYAGKIHLIGTDKGFGVNNQGAITATGSTQQLGMGALTLDSGGNLVNTGKILAKDAVTINTHDNTTQNDGTLLSEQADIAINTAKLNNTGTIYSSQTAKIAAKEAIANQSSIYGGVLQINTDKLNNTDKLIQTSTAKLDITTDILNNTDKALIGQSLYGQATVPTPSTPSSDQSAGNISSGPTDNTAGSTNLGANPQPPALSDSGANTQTKSLPNARGHITATHSIHNAGSQALISATGDIGISASQTHNTNQASIDAQTLNTKTLTNTDSKIALDDINWQLTSFDNSKGSITARDGMVIDTGFSIINTSGSLASGGDMTLIAKDSIVNQDGTITAREQADIIAKELQNGGSITADTLIITQQADYTHTDDDKLIANNLTLTTDGKLVNLSQLTANQDLTLNANHIDNTQTGSMTSGHLAQITSQTNITNQGLINSENTLIKAVGIIDNLAGGRIYGTQLAIQADTLNNTPAKAQSQQTNQEKSHHTNPVIAARERLDIGVKTLNNNPNPDRAGKFNEDLNNQALITSLGSLHIGGSLDDNQQAAGKAQTVVNKGATIQSGKQMQINTSVLKNKNADFKSRVEQKGDPTAITKYFVNNSTYDKKEGEVYIQETGWDGHWEKYLVTPDGKFNHYSSYEYLKTDYTTKTANSDPAMIRSGGELLFEFNQAFNIDSVVISGNTAKLNQDPTHAQNYGFINHASTGEDYHTQTNNNYFNHVTAERRRRDNPTSKRPYTYKNWVKSDNQPQKVLLNTYQLPILNATINTTPSSTGIDKPAAGDDISTIINIFNDGRDITLPTSALYIINADNPNLPLIQTDPAFTNYKQWLSSDYMLKALQSDPNHIHKRLSDGYGEQQRIKDQYYLLTGRHINTDYRSNEEAFKQLMDNGITHAKQFGYTLGTALTPEQMANLTTDIVWLVKQSITVATKDKDGNSITKTQDALVPKLYLRSATIATGILTPDGRYAAMSGKNMDLQLTGDLDNNGNLIAKDTMNIKAKNVTNDGRIYGNFVAVAADNTIANHGTMYANSAMSLDAGNQIINQSQTTTQTNTQGRSSSSRTDISQIATISVGTGLKDSADENGNPLTTLSLHGNQIIYQGATSDNAGGNTQMSAENSIHIGTVTVSNHISAVADDNNYFKYSQTEDVGSNISSYGDTVIATTGQGADITGKAANIRSGGVSAIIATGGVHFSEGRATSSTQSSSTHQESKWYGSKDITSTHESSINTAVLSSIDGDEVYVVSSNSDIDLIGTNINADKQVGLKAEQGSVTLQSAIDSVYQNNTRTTQNFYKNTDNVDGFYQETLAQTGVRAGSVDIQGNSANLNGVSLQATHGPITVGNAHLATNDDGALKLNDNGKPIVISGDMHNLNLGTVDLTNETWQESSKSYRGLAKDVMKGVGVAAGALGIGNDITLAKSQSNHTTDHTQAVTQLNANQIHLGASEVTAQGSVIDAGDDSFVRVLGDDVLFTTAKHSQSNTQTQTRQTITGEGIKLGKDHLQLGAVVHTDSTDTQSTQSTTHDGVTVRGNSAVVLGNMNDGSLTTQATNFDLDPTSGTLLIGAKSTLLDGAINQTTYTQSNETNTTRIGATVHHVAVDTAIAAENVKEAIQAANHARKELEQAKMMVKAGKLDPNAIKDYELNLAMATTNVANAQIALGSTAATAVSTTPTLGFSAKLGATHTQSQSSQTQTNQDFVATNITAANTTMVGDDFTTKGLQGTIGKLNIDNLNKLTLTYGTTTNTTQSQSSTNTTDASVSSTGSISAGVGRHQGQSRSNTTTAYDTKLALGEFNGYAEQTTLHGATIITDGGYYSTDVLNVTTSQNHQTQRGSSKGGNIGVGASSLNLGYNEQKSQSDITTNNTPSGILYVTKGTAGSAHSLTANHTAVTGGMIAAISQDEQGNQTNSPVNFTTNTLTTQDLIATEYSQNIDFGINVGLTRKQGDIKASSIGLSANNSGHDKQTLTLATIGQGATITDAITHNGQAQTTTDISQTDINTDALNTQKVIKDQKTGGLDVNTTIDTRVFTTAGRQEIKKEQMGLPQNLEAVGKTTAAAGVQTVATAANLLTGNQSLTQIIQGAKAPAKMAKVIQDYPEVGAILDAYQKGEYHNLALSQEALQAISDATGVSTEVLLTSITAHQGIQGATNKELTVIDIHDELRQDSIQTLAHELDHVRYGTSEALADLAGLAAKLNTDAAIIANQDRINPIKAQLENGKDEITTAQNQALLEGNDKTFVDNQEGKEGEWGYSSAPIVIGATIIYHKNLKPIGINEHLSKSVTSEQMYGHYIHGNGRPLTTDQLAVTNKLRDAMKKEGAFGKADSVENRFAEQIVDSYKKGNNNYAFKSSYKVGSEIKVWAFGSGVISGQFNGAVNKLSDGKYRVKGTINYQFSDVFEDPYDTFNWVHGSYDPSGTPYNITGAWSENIDKIVSIKK